MADQSRYSLELGIPLVVGLCLFVPAVSLVGAEAGAGLLPSLLFAVAVVGIGYLVYIISVGRFVAGVLVSLIVLSTFGANLPIGVDQAYLARTPGSLGPQLWLFQAPLIVLAGYFIYTWDSETDSVSRTEVLFGAFVGWSVLSAVFGAGPRTDVAILFAWAMFQALIVMAVIRRAVERGILRLEAVITTYIVALLGHMAYGLVQLLNQRPTGMSFLGESVPWRIVSYPPGLENLVIPSGFLGGHYIMIATILLVFPSMLWLSYKAERPWSLLILALAVLAAVFLRLTTSDAGRGAFIVLAASLIGIGILAVLSDRGRWIPSVETAGIALKNAMSSIRITASLLIAVIIVMVPSSESGQASSDDPSPGLPGSNSNGSANPDGAGSPPPQSGSTPVPSGADEAGGREFTLPFFDLTNLGTRLQQYVAGLDMFIKNPLFGVGGGNFRFVAIEYGVSSSPSLPIPSALHNIYIMLLAETGLPGFLLYFGAVGLVLWSSVKAYFHDFKPVLQVALVAGIVSYLSFMFFTHLIDHIVPLVIFWGIAGAILGEYRYGVRESVSGGSTS